MIRRINDYSYIDDESLQKIAEVVNNQKKLIKITDNIKTAKAITKQLKDKNYESIIEQVKDNYYIYTLPQQKVLFTEAKSSGCFKRIASNQYEFTKQANNPLGITHYNFDEGTIWKVMTAKDGKDYLVKEIDDKTEQIIRQPCEKAFSTMVITADNKDPQKIFKLCKLLYNDVNEDFIKDLTKYSSIALSSFLSNKLNNVIDSELEYLNITSPEYKKNVHEKIAMAINNNQISNRQHISNIIKGGVNFE